MPTKEHPMTYDDLLTAIQKMTPEQRSMDLTIFTIGEFYLAELLVSDDADVLDANHPYFKIVGEQ